MNTKMRMWRCPGIAVLLCAVASCSATAQDAVPTDPALVELADQAAGIRGLIATVAVGEVLHEVADLKPIEPRTIWFRRTPRTALTEQQFQLLAESEREGFEALQFDTRRYHHTFYGTPLASLRALDVAAGAAGWESFDGLRVLDIGYGSIGQLKLLAAVGARVTGIEVEPLLHTLYGFPGDTGEARSRRGRRGEVELVLGLWPRDVSSAVGSGFDLIISKNTLKKGYVTPEEPAPQHGSVDLSVSPHEYVEALRDALKPGGFVLIYNIGPAPGPDGRGVNQEGEATYVHMADIRCPFPRDVWEEAGLEVISFDEDDSEMIRRFAAAFGWGESDQGAVDLSTNFFASYTLVRKPE